MGMKSFFQSVAFCFCCFLGEVVYSQPNFLSPSPLQDTSLFRLGQVYLDYKVDTIKGLIYIFLINRSDQIFESSNSTEFLHKTVEAQNFNGEWKPIDFGVLGMLNSYG